MLATTSEAVTPTLSHPEPIAQEELPTEEGSEIVLPLDDRPAPETALPVPLLLTLASDRALLRPGEIAHLTLNAWRATEEKIDGMVLTVTLPKVLETVKPETPLRWALPELKNTEIFSQSIAVQLAAGSLLFESAVVTATVQTAATDHFSANGATVLLGLAAAEQRPPEEPVTSAPLAAAGLVLQGRYGDVTVLVEPNSAEPSTKFTYSDGYRWAEAAAAATDLVTATTPISTAAVISGSGSANALYLPLVRGGEGVEAAKSEGAAEPQPPVDKTELIEDNGVSFVCQWTLSADYQGEKRDTFAKRIHLVIDARWLLDRGFDPTRLTLYTWADAKQPWEEVPSTSYDAAQQAFHAVTPHFSEYGLGLSQGVVGAALPDVSSFGNDLFTGAATINYPLEAPAGSGGMAPQLSLNYSSATVDSQRWENNKNQSDGYRIQAGLAGIGWDFSALNHIAFIDEGTDPYSTTDNRYSLVLNGTSTTFLDGQTVTESFARIQKNLTTVTNSSHHVVHTGEWIITTPDGTKHYFGGPAIDPTTAATNANQSVMLHNIGDANTYRVVNKWYLRKSVDTNGNYVDYTYLSDARTTNCSTNNNYRGAGGWYYRAMRPNTISWGGNQTTGAGHPMQATFTYEGRSDTGIYKKTDVCTQSIYSDYRLKTVRMQVYSEGAWRALREYELGYLYTSGTYQHSWLNTIKLYGFTGTGSRTGSPLNTYTFDYTIGAIHSEVYLQSADNGWGGKVIYNYATPATWRCEIDNTTNCDQVAYRRQVNGKTIYDGTTTAGGNWSYTAYGYSEGLYRRYKNDPVDFLGYPTAWSITYAFNTYDEAKATEH